jgi:hypothetical protein
MDDAKVPFQSLSEAPKHGLKNIHDPSNLCPEPCT